MTAAAARLADTVIRIADLRFRYAEGGFALAIPKLEIARGEKLAVIGPSGSGKTTLLHLIAGIEVPESGVVHACGEALSSQDAVRRRAFRIRRIGLVFQEFELLDYLSVHDNILLPYRLNPAVALDQAAHDRARQLAEEVGIGDKHTRLATRLSQGERQRAAVCRALVTAPEIVLADEPTGNLDPSNKDRVLETLTRYVDEKAATLLVVTHDHGLLHHFDRVIDFREFRPPSDRAEQP
jgi:putative ABC transport system ATP-binding protein